MQRQADRVNYSYSMKIPGPVQYSSITFSSSYSTDLQQEETPEDAIERARKFVMSEIEKDYNDATSDGESNDDDEEEFAEVRSEGKHKRRKKDD